MSDSSGGSYAGAFAVLRGKYLMTVVSAHTSKVARRKAEAGGYDRFGPVTLVEVPTGEPRRDP